MVFLLVKRASSLALGEGGNECQWGFEGEIFCIGRVIDGGFGREQTSIYWQA